MKKLDQSSHMKRIRNATTGVRIKNTRIKRQIFDINTRQIILAIILSMVFMISGIGYVWSTFERTQIGYNISELQEEEKCLREKNRNLRLELAYLKSTQNLEKLAMEKLGLNQPSPEQIIILP